MKKIKFTFLSVLLGMFAIAGRMQAQVKVGSNPTNIDASAVLELESTNKGFLPPRMTQAQMNAISSPAEGLVVYCKDCLPKGLYVNTSSTATPNWLSASNPGAGAISVLSCGSATISQTLIAGTSAAGSSISIPYTGGNGGTYSAQTVVSSGVAGVTATLAPGTFSGSGSLVYTLSGTPSAAGTASFSFTIGGQTCSFSTTVYSGTIGSITNASQPAVNYYIKYYNGNYWLYAPSSPGRVLLSNTTSGTDHYWHFINTGAGQYAIYNPATGYMIDNGSANYGNANYVDAMASLSSAVSNARQRFVLQTISGSAFSGGVIGFTPSLATGQGFDLPSCNAYNGAGLQYYAYNGNGCQLFTLQLSQSLTNGVATPANYQVSLGYFGGNGGTYPAQTIASTGVTGLTATLSSGTLQNGNLGALTFTITGTPSAAGTASFPVFIGGQSFTFSLTVN